MKYTKVFVIIAVLCCYQVQLKYFQYTKADTDNSIQSTDSTITTPLQNSSGIGSPLEGLNAAELIRFEEGKKEFERVHKAEEGLGPAFNADSCVACHSAPVTGGAVEFQSNFSRRIGRIKDGKFDAMADFGGPVMLRKVIPGECKPSASSIPPEADFIGIRAAQACFGLGLLEAVTDETILANADPDDKNNDGISGRPNMVKSTHFGDTRPGRFGWKLQNSNLFDQVGDAYLIQMGITNPDFPNDRRINGKPPECDSVKDPEDTTGAITQKLVDYVTFLAAPPRGITNEAVKEGEKLFSSIGCIACHLPTLKTGPSPISAIAGKEIHPYTDLLLHDMGPDLTDNIVQGQSLGTEWRTAPLWGLSKNKFLLHDGRTSDISTAIIVHGGEALKSRTSFLNLKKKDRTNLLAFLNSL